MKFKNSVMLNDNNEMPSLGFGVYQIADNVAENIVGMAFHAGYQLIDTATIYQNESGVGKAIKNSRLSRDEFFITTKIWNDDQGRDSTRRALDTSLAKLGLDYIDLYLIHWPSPHREKFVETWAALIDLQREGKIKSIGVSNFAIEHLEKIIRETGVIPVVNQVELHPRFQQRSLRAFHDKYNIKTESWSPLGRAKYFHESILNSIAQKHKKTLAQVILRWHFQSGLIAIPKTVTESRIQENINLFDFTLDSDDLNQIASLDSTYGRIGPHPLQTDF